MALRVGASARFGTFGVEGMTWKEASAAQPDANVAAANQKRHLRSELPRWGRGGWFLRAAES
ncbi:hypothetical protein HIM_07708 [Hirsutella minnesotensis 3608]|uniref:Uncharacterized protein n=1 Tax=Hirsutella minnesotensis 3608 TaxID=1043627 RepID=A0A0F7ZN12_9HYPO|nr:hypothetical protein HIM_07708 [Hirsutella minnesotensis 3608]